MTGPLTHRRFFVTLLGTSAAAWPLAARAQQPIKAVIGWLGAGSAEPSQVASFRRGLSEQGFVDGQNVVIDYHWANNVSARLPALATDLVRRQPTVIVASTTVPAILAAKNATSTIPIVFAGGADPVKYGLVASLNRPGGNITGVTPLNLEIMGKQLDLLQKLAPHVTTVGYVSAPAYAAPWIEDANNDVAAAARSLGLQMVSAHLRGVNDFEAAFANFVQHQVGALLVAPYQFLFNNRDKLVALATRHRIPACYANRSWVSRGGLMSYGADFGEVIRQVASAYVARILKGDKPADLPVQQPTKFEMAINLKTARKIGIEVPPILLAIADEVIE